MTKTEIDRLEKEIVNTEWSINYHRNKLNEYIQHKKNTLILIDYYIEKEKYYNDMDEESKK